MTLAHNCECTPKTNAENDDNAMPYLSPARKSCQKANVNASNIRARAMRWRNAKSKWMQPAKYPDPCDDCLWVAGRDMEIGSTK